MAAPKKRVSEPVLRPRIRILCGDSVAFGPGKAELLEHVAETHSLNQAAKRMGMSYMKAWLLVGIMNRSYKKPLIKMERGGAKGGGAELTALGKRILSLYQQMHRASLEAMEGSWKEIRKSLKPPQR
jgi:molybdate transport system regulatory protein